MATPLQIAANKRNAQKSTGPKTVAGKLRSRFNAVTHGMTGQIIVMPHECDEEYHQVRAGLIEDYAPATSQEMMLVDQVAAGYWRTMRARAIEVDMLSAHVEGKKRQHGKSVEPDPDKDDLCIAVVFDGEDPKSFDNYMRYDAAISRDYFRALNTLEKIQSRRMREKDRARRTAMEEQRELRRIAERPDPDTIAEPVVVTYPPATPEPTLPQPSAPARSAPAQSAPVAPHSIGFVSYLDEQSTAVSTAAQTPNTPDEERPLNCH